VFITLEGIDRSGKTTQAARLVEALGPRAVALREPGGTDAGERIRELLKDGSIELDPRAELLLFCAARAELCERVIEPALADGRDVVCDRFIDSTVAYQGIGRGLGAAMVQSLNEIAVAGREPDLTVLLRVDPAAAAERPGDPGDRFEAEGLEFQRIVAAAYDEIAARHPSRIEVVDGAGDPDDVHARVLELVEARR
jgi:dTMP kinase